MSDGVQSIYVIRHLYHHQYQEHGERYDIFSDTWEPIAPMPDVGVNPGNYCTAALFDKQIITYKIAFFTQYDQCGYSEMVYSIAKDEWQFIRQRYESDVLIPYRCKAPLSLAEYTFIPFVDREKGIIRFYYIKKKRSKKKLLCLLPIETRPYNRIFGPVALSRAAVDALYRRSVHG